MRKIVQEILKLFRRETQIYKVLDFLMLTLEAERQRMIMHNLEFYTQPNYYHCEHRIKVFKTCKELKKSSIYPRSVPEAVLEDEKIRWETKRSRKEEIEHMAKGES